MKRILATCAIVALAVLLASPAVMAGKVKHPSSLKYPKLELEPPGYEEVEFGNGMRGFFIEDHEVPVVDILMLVSTDRAPKEKTGLNDLAAWAVRNGGGESWDADRINDELEFVAARLEVDGYDRSTYIGLNCLKKDLPMCLEILADLLVSPAFPEEKIELRRETMLENIRRENDEPRRIARREFGKVLYGDHPMAWQDTEQSVRAITRDDIAAHHSAYFRPNNTIIGISGDVTLDEITGLLDGALAGWEPADVTIEPEPPIEPTYVPSVNYVHKDVSQGVIYVGHLGLNSRDENLPAVRIMNFILGGGSFTSRITQKVRTDEGLAYAAYSQYGDDPWTYGTFIASSQTRADATARATTLIMEIIADMRENGPTDDEVERAVDTYLNNHVFDYDSKQSVVRNLMRLAWEGRPLDTRERNIETIGSLTVDDVRNAAAEYLHPDGLIIMVVGNADEFEQPLSNFGEVNVIELD
ncbi:MAG: pitrilysin family protein [Candidatus Eisenbacteria bacterium]